MRAWGWHCKSQSVSPRGVWGSGGVRKVSEATAWARVVGCHGFLGGVSLGHSWGRPRVCTREDHIRTVITGPDSAKKVCIISTYKHQWRAIVFSPEI